MRYIFFSWQSDLENRYHRNFIEGCIRKAIKEMEKDSDIQIYMDYDRDTMGLSGSPDISSAIFDKIEKSSLFVGDVSNIVILENNKGMPNPNVMIELGYAAKILGWEKIICFYNINTGSIDNLPFDLRQKRILVYDPLKEGEKRRVTNILIDNIKSLYTSGKLFNPLTDYMKGKIDATFLDISKGLSNLLFETVSMSEGLSNTPRLLNLSIMEIENRLSVVNFPGFIFFNTYKSTNEKLKNILKDLFTSNYFSKDWVNIVLQLIDWIRIYNHAISPRNKEPSVIYLNKTCSEKYTVISGHSINFDNPVDSHIVLEIMHTQDNIQNNTNTFNGKVINTTYYPDENPRSLEMIYKINDDKVKYISKIIFEFVTLCNKWLELTDSEFVLDPDIYTIY